MLFDYVILLFGLKILYRHSDHMYMHYSPWLPLPTHGTNITTVTRNEGIRHLSHHYGTAKASEMTK